jgi:transposase-like protein
MSAHDSRYSASGLEASAKRRLLQGVPMVKVAKSFGVSLSVVRRWRRQACDELLADLKLFEQQRAAKQEQP